MSDFLETIVNMGIIRNMGVVYRPVLKVESSTINSRNYSLIFPDKKELVFKVEYQPEKGVELHFISTTIIHISTLSMVLLELNNGFNVSSFEIQRFFEKQVNDMKK